MNASKSPTCYYSLVPLDQAKVDTDGHVKGGDLRGTRGYERLVDMLSKYHAESTPASPNNEAQARADVDRMKFKSGTQLLAPCHAGHGAADRVAPGGVVQPDRIRVSRSLQPACQPAGLWQRIFDSIAQFVGGVNAQAGAAMTVSRMATPARDIDRTNKPAPD